ncbi:hypothetical protein [Pantoea agglomerans]|uniref:ParB/Sulfiredoxin domain-containing protein n=1 Tax=Enterobacter agglomerans TaxID=549 RepID=A0ABD6XL84_ENTAG|nr:hypothetical protein [Pantoea agglomerans]MDQ0631000.1 hypothetical protein [Pantoea agglomerans]WNK71580.1 hypothetical protein RM155_00640 [Pantoea agglomerans]
MTPKTINISNLLLDLDNPRFPRIVESQREALNLMIEIQTDKIELLASDIAKYGLDPSERLIVYKNEVSEDAKSYTVAEGNRRLTALKLLQEPDLTENEKVKSRIKKIIKTSIYLPKEIDCIIFDNPEDFDHWINLKHSGQNNGIGRVRWDTVEQGRYQSKHGNSSFGSQFWQFLENEKSIPDTISKNKKHLRLTNITRMLDDPYVRDALGLEVVNSSLFCNQPKERFVTEICKLISSMQELDEKGKPFFKVNKIMYKKDRQDVIDDLNIIKPAKKLDKVWEIANPNSYQQPSSNSGKGNKPGTNSRNDKEDDIEVVGSDKDSNIKTGDNSKGSLGGKNDNGKKESNPNRNYLIPSSIQYKIYNKKCKHIYDELKGQLRHDLCPLSIAYMFRAFLELSVICHMDKNRIERKNSSSINDNIILTTEHLYSQRLLTKDEVDSIISTLAKIIKNDGSVQEYIEDIHILPKKSVLNKQFDELNCLFSAIWR